MKNYLKPNHIIFENLQSGCIQNEYIKFKTVIYKLCMEHIVL